MITKAHLPGKKVVFKLKTPFVYFGVVKHVEDDGFWIEAPTLMTVLAADAAWGTIVSGLGAKNPVFFLPTSSLEYLIVPDEGEE
jgi:hypothetical protein